MDKLKHIITHTPRHIGYCLILLPDALLVILNYACMIVHVCCENMLDLHVLYMYLGNFKNWRRLESISQDLSLAAPFSWRQNMLPMTKDSHHEEKSLQREGCRSWRFSILNQRSKEMFFSWLVVTEGERSRLRKNIFYYHSLVIRMIYWSHHQRSLTISQNYGEPFQKKQVQNVTGQWRQLDKAGNFSCRAAN